MTLHDATKARLLEASGQEFAEKGFEAARVRSICQKADANLAAVNYHFGDKEQLYIAAVLEAHRCGTSALPEAEWSGLRPAEQLRGYIRHFLENVLAVRKSTWHHTLMLREMLSPSLACEVLVRDAIRPRFERLLTILGAICPEAEERRLHALAFSVIGQCLHYKVATEVSERLVGVEGYRALDLDFLSEHIGSFTLAALGMSAPIGLDGCAGEEPSDDVDAGWPPRTSMDLNPKSGGASCPGSR